MMQQETNKMKYRQRRWITAGLFLAVAVTGFLYARRQPGILAEEAGTDGETLTFHAEVSLQYHYALCGHDMEQEADVRRYIGLTEEQLCGEEILAGSGGFAKAIPLLLPKPYSGLSGGGGSYPKAMRGI